MNTQELVSIFENRKGFLGVFSSDQIKTVQLTNNPQCMIINLDPSHLPGSHWVAVCLHKTKTGERVIEYFDSYGTSLPGFKTPEGWKLRYSRTSLQSPWSTSCGHYCVYFTDHRLLSINFETILHMLTKEGDSDSLVEKYVEANYGNLLRSGWTEA